MPTIGPPKAELIAPIRQRASLDRPPPRPQGTLPLTHRRWTQSSHPSNCHAVTVRSNLVFVPLELFAMSLVAEMPVANGRKVVDRCDRDLPREKSV